MARTKRSRNGRIINMLPMYMPSNPINVVTQEPITNPNRVYRNQVSQGLVYNVFSLANIINHAEHAPPGPWGRVPAKFPIDRRVMTREDMVEILSRARGLGWTSDFKVEKHTERRQRARTAYKANSNAIHHNNAGLSNTNSVNTQSTPHNHITFGANSFEHNFVRTLKLFENDLAQMQKDYTQYALKYKLEREHPYNPIDPPPVWPKAREAYKWMHWYLADKDSGILHRHKDHLHRATYVYFHPDGAPTRHVSEIRSGFYVDGSVASRYYSSNHFPETEYPRMEMLMYLIGTGISIKLTFEFRASDVTIIAVKLTNVLDDSGSQKHEYTSKYTGTHLFKDRKFKTTNPDHVLTHLLSSLGGKIEIRHAPRPTVYHLHNSTSNSD